MEIRSTETIKQAVIAGMGVSFLSAHTISQELRAGSLACSTCRAFR
jgi:DNA-binding transcriptional LysR family regulator